MREMSHFMRKSSFFRVKFLKKKARISRGYWILYPPLTCIPTHKPCFIPQNSWFSILQKGGINNPQLTIQGILNYEELSLFLRKSSFFRVKFTKNNPRISRGYWILYPPNVYTYPQTMFFLTFDVHLPYFYDFYPFSHIRMNNHFNMEFDSLFDGMT